MYKTTKLILMAAVLLVLLSAGNATAQEKHDIKLNVEKGLQWPMQLIMEQSIDQSVMGQTMETKQSTIMDMDLEVMEVSETGDVTIRYQYTRVQVTMNTGPRGTVKYDSADPESGTGGPETMAYKALIGKEFTAVLGPNAAFKEVNGMDKILEDMVASLGLAETQKAELKKVFETQFGNDAMEDMMSQSAIIYPDEPVAVGDSWNRKFTISAGFPMTMENTFTLNGADDTTYTIGFASTITPNEDGDGMVMGGVKMDMKMEGSQEGTSTIDRETGMVINTTINQTIHGEAKMSGVDMGGQDFSVPMDIDSTITFKKRN